jgi:cell division protein FtsN
MATMSGRSRARGGPGKVQWAAFGGAALVILGLTFALGMLVGRQWARQTPPTATAEAGRKSATAPRRGGLADAAAERAVAPSEKLTFYQTLTAPLGTATPAVKNDAAAKPVAAAKPRPTAAATTERIPPREEEPSLPSRAAAGAAPPEGSAVEPVADERRVASHQWAVQVGVFRNAQQADRLKRELAEAGFPAQVTTATADDGQLRYRVRVSGFKTRDEALRAAERVRSDRSLPTYVTAAR